MLRVLEIEGHSPIETDHQGGLVTVSCECGGFKVQGDTLTTAEAFDQHMWNAGARAGLEPAA